jgi:hypothetical protein
LPKRSFESRRIKPLKANSLSLVRFDDNDYSVPTEYAHRQVTAVGGIEEVRFVVDNRVVARHGRDWGREQVFFDPRHYLALLERKPGAFDYARPLENWELPECFWTLRRRQEAALQKQGTREFIRVLRLLEWANLEELTGAVEQALDLGASTVDAVRLILEHRRERPTRWFRLDSHPQLAGVHIPPPNLHAYTSLTIGGEA